MRMRRGLSALLAVVVAMAVCCAGAVAPAWAHEAVDLDRTGSLSVSMTYDGKAVGGGELTLYLVGAVAEDDGDFSFALTEEFAGSEVSLADVEAAGLAEALGEYAVQAEVEGAAYDIPAGGTLEVDDLELGLYLAVQTVACDGYQAAAPFVVSVPGYDEAAGVYVYDVNASPKVGSLELEPEKPVEETPADPGETEQDLPVTGTQSWLVPIMVVAGLGLLLVGAAFVLGKRGSSEA